MRVMWIHEDIDQAKPFYLDSDDCELVILKHWTITCELCKENIVAWIIWGIYMHIYQSKHHGAAWYLVLSQKAGQDYPDRERQY